MLSLINAQRFNEKGALATPSFNLEPFFSSLLSPESWAELKGGWAKTYRKAKPREDGPLEAIFGDPPKAVSEVVS